MILAILSTMSASLLLAITNHIDKFMISDNENSNIKALLVFSTLIAGIILFPLWLIVNKFTFNFDITIFSIIFCSAFCFTFSGYFYFKAIEITDASIVVALFQIVPIFSLILTYIFFNEVLTFTQLGGILIIIISTIVMMLKKVNGLFNFKPFIFMLIVTISSSLYYFLLEYAINLSNYNSALLMFQLSLFLIGLFLIFFKSYRNSFFDMLDRRKKLIGFNILNEAFTLIANMLNNFANLFIPLAIVNALNSIQVVFAFLIGCIGTIIFPKFFKEDINKMVVLKKIICIIFELIGVFLLVI